LTNSIIQKLMLYTTDSYPGSWHPNFARTTNNIAVRAVCYFICSQNDPL